MRHDIRHESPHRLHQRKSRRKLNGISSDLAGNKRLPNVPLHHHCFFHRRASIENSKTHPGTKPPHTRLEIPHSLFIHQHRLISDHRRTSIDQYRDLIRLIKPSTTKSTESPLGKTRGAKNRAAIKTRVPYDARRSRRERC
ncbi:hypothetical protein Bca4012_046584 [Brassica carinata]